MSAAPLLAADGLDTYYGRAHILHGVSLQVAPGEAVALAGRNGAGKSTTLKALMGLVPAARGRVTFAGNDITGLAPYRIARLGLGYVPEERRIFTALTVEENLMIAARPAPEGFSPWTPDRLYSLFPNLAEMRDRRASAMSGGEQQMLAVARTLTGNPRALLLDEPSEGLAPRIVAQLATALEAVRAEGLAILLAEQNLRFAAKLCTRAYVIESGAIRHEGPMNTLMEDEALRRAHLSV